MEEALSQHSPVHLNHERVLLHAAKAGNLHKLKAEFNTFKVIQAQAAGYQSAARRDE